MNTIEASMTQRTTRLIPVLFTATIFLSAALLFFVQPLFAKIALPQIGGAPAVWTTAMLFFQTVLIAGYLYAHLLTRYVPQRAQIAIHIAFWALALTFLPLGLPAAWSYDPAVAPAWQTLTLFAAGVGVPFAVLSANAPLIQSWYAKSGGPSADDPYFLYGASNLGSLMALLAFPLAAEPLFGATAIGQGWAVGFGALGIFLALSGLSARARAQAVAEAAPAARSALTPGTIAYWLILAFVPSSLMLAVTAQISTDLGAIPLVWVIPLSLYLLTFVLTFTRRPLVSTAALRLAAIGALAVLGAVYSGLVGAHLSWGWVGGMVAAFFVVALFVHRKLYEARPDESRLTQFYVVMSVGGALGGLFNSILAPVIFDGLYEGGITTLIAVMLVLGGWSALGRRKVLIALGLGLIGALIVIAAVQILGKEGRIYLGVLLFVLPAAALVYFRKSLPAGALAAGTIALLGGAQIPDDTIRRDRGFFGTHKVENSEILRVYSNGTTVHGAQTLTDLAEERPTPLYYYHPNGPMAQILTSGRAAPDHSVGIVGLGVGSLACYAQPGQDWAFYEIDPIVDRIARDPELFTFMSSCAGDAPTHLGDARIVLAEQEGTTYDLLFIDAYSSDAVPVHLTTLEATALYIERLAPGGLLIFHISNRYYAIDRPLARSAAALGLEARMQIYRGSAGETPGDTPSIVVMIARDEADFGALAGDPRWSPITSDGGPVWTDDHANLLSILHP